MENSHPPRNRRERRAQAQAHSSTSTSTTNSSISLSQPSRKEPVHKTLLEIAAERQLLNPQKSKDGSHASPSISAVTVHPDGTLSVPSDLASLDDPIPTPNLDIAIYTLTLTLLHFTLTLLVHHQYASEPPSLVPLFLSSTVFSLTPALLFLLVCILHPRTSQVPVQVLFAAMSIIAGGWLVYATNDEPYMAVMQKAPALGTLWVWAVVEMKWEWAVGCLTVVGGWGWWRGYSIF